MEEKQNGHGDKMKGGGMGKRGVTRPMAEMKMNQHKHEMHGGDGDKGEDHSMMMSDEMRGKMLHMHHMQTLWVYWTILF